MRRPRPFHTLYRVAAQRRLRILRVRNDELTTRVAELEAVIRRWGLQAPAPREFEATIIELDESWDRLRKERI